MRYPSSCWFLLALILDPSANSSMLLYSFMSSMVAEPSARGCWRAVRVPGAAAAERCMELDLKWRRKRSGRRLRPPFIAAPPANREGCWAVTWRWVRRAPCREELEASEGRRGASCRGARGRQWERLREAKVAGAEGNNGGGTWESRGGTSIAGLRVRSKVAPGGWAEITGKSVQQDRRAGNPERRCRRATVPLALRAVCVRRPVRLSPLLRPQSPSAELLRRLLQQKGGVHPAPLAEAAALPPARPAHACFVLAPAGISGAEKRVRDDRLRSGVGGVGSGGLGCRISAARVRAFSPAGRGRGGGRGLPG